MTEKQQSILLELIDVHTAMCNNLNRRVDDHNNMFEVVKKSIDVLDKMIDNLESKIANIERKIEGIKINQNLSNYNENNT
jgi:lipoate-protein ligase A